MRPSVVVCVLGSTNVDLQLTVASLPAAGETVLATRSVRLPGGKGANQAVALARLGATVRFCSAVGEDGGWLLEHLVSEGVPVEDVVVHPGSPTGLAVVTVDSTGENSIVVVPGANSLVVPPSDLVGVDVLLVSLEIPLAVVQAALRSARAAGVTVVLNAAPAQALSKDLLEQVDVLVVNETEAAAMSVEGARAVVITRGGAGALVRERDATTVVPAHPARLVDTTGAGDCFAAALARFIGSGEALVEAARLACLAAGLSVEHSGAQAGSPTLAGLRRAQP